ncbi:MAG: IS5 family transposase [Candidatus Nitrosocosmicus sp.]
MLEGKVPSIPDYSTISRRINKLDIKIKDDNKSKEFENDYIVIAIDTTGIKVTNRGQCMRRDKWKIRKKGYLKIHVAEVDVKIKKILSMKVTDEHVHDSKALPELVEDVIKSNKITAIGKLFADDGAYEGNDIFECLADNGILPCIKVRKNAKVRLKTGHIIRNLSVISQKNDLQGWTDSIVSYGHRWIVETVFSSIKRMFDREYVYSVKLKNIIQEMMLKALLYNKIISI